MMHRLRSDTMETDEIPLNSWKDIERDDNDGYLYNDTVGSFHWSHINVSITDKTSKKEKYLLQDVNGSAHAGELVAILGPSGSGKTTLLNILASRAIGTKASIGGELYVNRARIGKSGMQKIARYVQQEDILIGSLTTRETLDFAARLGMHDSVTKTQRHARVTQLLASFGLSEQANTLIGTPVRKGLSGGQKRRVSVASSLITAPKILFLDEPTSGLDSAASYEVMSYLKSIARKNKIIIITSLHQPSASTYALLDKIHLLSKGHLCYAAPRQHIPGYFASIGYPIPPHVNIPEFLLDLTNTDFSSHQPGSSAQRLARITDEWRLHARQFAEYYDSSISARYPPLTERVEFRSMAARVRTPWILLQRNWVKSYRDVFAYGIRVAMYLGLAFMMGTVWLRMGSGQVYIQPVVNAIFFGSAFMSFMAVAYVPAFLEDRAVFTLDRANNLVSPPSFLLANFLIGAPYLFLIALLFSLLSYFLVGFRADGSAFGWYVLWLFLDLLAAESLVVLVSCIARVFVVSLAVVAFVNGLWMSVGGFLVSPGVLGVVWRGWARYIDYQSYVFQGMMVNEFTTRVFDCARLKDNSCQCMYTPLREDSCKMSGQAVLDSFGYVPGWQGLWVGIMICIILAYRLLALLVLYVRKT